MPYRAVFAGPLTGNCGYTQETAEAAIAAGDADMIAFGRPWLSNPDLEKRLANGWEGRDAVLRADGGGLHGFPVSSARLSHTRCRNARSQITREPA